jgi:hypothetical protein
MLSVLCLCAFTICAILFVGTQVYWRTWGRGDYDLPFINGIPGFLLAVGAVAMVRLSSANASRGVTARLVIQCVAGLLIAMLGGCWFFGTPVREFAEQIGGHGFWGWLASYPDGLDTLRAAPRIIFGPLIVALAWRGWRVARRQRPGPRYNLQR